MSKRVEDLRADYSKARLGESSVDPDPIKQFSLWFDEALRSSVVEPNGMVLSTTSNTGRPAGRVVLLKGFDESGFSFYTNYESRKGREIASCPMASLTFWWIPLERQIRIEGRIESVSPEESDRYFGVRPRGSQLGAWASKQSAVIDSRDVLESTLANVTRQFDGRDVERPPHWGGYLVVPDLMEFWQGRSSRLHDRIQYKIDDNGKWQIDRLSP